MKNSIIPKIILIVLGLLLTVLGSWRLFDPIAFFNNSGLFLEDTAGLLSEARGIGGVIVGFGLLILSGAFIRKLSFTSTIAAIVVFLGFGVARLIGYSMDGYPGDVVIQGMVFEFVLGGIAVFALLKYREK